MYIYQVRYVGNSLLEATLKRICQDGPPHTRAAREGNSHSAWPTTFEAAAGERSRHKIPPDDLDPRQSTSTMSDSQVTLRTRKFIRNPLLGRKQMVVCVQSLHRAAENASPSAAAAHR